MILKVCVFVFVSVSCALAANRTLDDCPANLPRDRYLRVFGDSCFSFQITQKREFSVAERQCEARHGHLIIIRDAATQQFIYNTLHRDFHYSGAVWLGLTDTVSEGHYVWVDGTAAHYTNWASGQPGLVGGLEDCAAMEMDSGGKWHDYPCQGFLFLSQDHVFVCEYPISSPTTVAMTTSQMMTTNTAMPSSLMTSDSPMTSEPVTTQVMTTMPMTTAACPTFDCSLDCGLAGYQIDDSGCMVCACEGE